MENETARIQELLNIGQQMSNVCYNLSQSEQLPLHTRELVRDLYKKWDLAIRLIKT